MTDIIRTPKFCSVCGVVLEEHATRTGFDPFTGEPEIDVTLHCPNPDQTVSTKVLSSSVNTKYSYHPTWSLVSGEWITF